MKIHGEIRWLVALVGAFAAVRYAYGLARRAEYKGLDRALMAAFTGLLDLNLLLGLVLLFGLGGLPGFRLEHAMTMLLAVVAAHASAAWRKSDDALKKFRNNLIVVLIAILLIAVGVLRLRGGWVF
jgi:hypothetical protein